jgi:hypothetical protein
MAGIAHRLLHLRGAADLEERGPERSFRRLAFAHAFISPQLDIRGELVIELAVHGPTMDDVAPRMTDDVE